jgi:hypothetical protein
MNSIRAQEPWKEALAVGVLITILGRIRIRKNAKATCQTLKAVTERVAA